MDTNSYNVASQMSKPTSENGKNKTIEDTYQKVTQLEHILLRPDTYIGSAERITQTMWVWDGLSGKMVYRDVSYVPGLYKIFDEILVNAADHKQRDASLDTIEVNIDVENNSISVYNNGSGIPVEVHKKEGVYVPEMIFGQLLTSSNYNDDEKKVVGGRNGYGAKLANIFSSEFVIETSDSTRGRAYKQVFRNNMQDKQAPVVREMTTAQIQNKKDFTRITFRPDLKKFGITHLDQDIVALLKKRVYDIAGVNPTVKVVLNGERIPVKSFKDYVNLYMHEKPEVPLLYEKPNDRWEVIVTASDGQFNQVSFVNSIWTIKGGTQVNHVADLIVNKLGEFIAKKNKGVKAKPFAIKSHLSVFVNCQIENPAFDSQTKETLTSRPSLFGSKFELSEDLFKKICKSGIVENILAYSKFKQEKELAKTDGGKRAKLVGVPKLDDANKAGTRESYKCTLILTEGDSAKALAISGLSVIGRDYYGVFPLRGKLLNVREANHKQIMDNQELTNLKKILGLQHGKKYDAESVKQLRYGHLVIMTDQDHDGSHIKGLLINFLEHFWPSLLEVKGFLQEFITPIVKCSKSSDQKIFFTLPEYRTWFESLTSAQQKAWHIKYYKGLGTSTSAEAREYFGNLNVHLLDFVHGGLQCNQMIELAFAKAKVNDRKQWLSDFDPQTYFDHIRDELSYSNFINKELILFSMADNERSIPSVVDGFKPSQRKVLFACFKRRLKNEIKVAQLAGYVSEHAAYHHGEASLMSTIVGLAQNYVGANNVNLLVPSGQFGTRLQGGKDAASARYIFTRLADITRCIFPESDDHVLSYMEEDGLSIEPRWYCPIIPMVLVNGADGIGTGWSTSVPCHKPEDIIDALLDMLHGRDPKQLQPWYRDFQGRIQSVGDSGSYEMYGSAFKVDSETVKITELPIGLWTGPYKEWLEGNVVGSASNSGSSSAAGSMENKENKTPFIKEIRDMSTEDHVNFTVTVNSDTMADEANIYRKMKLMGTISTTNMVLFDAEGRIRKYDTANQILREFYSLRLEMFSKRKQFLLNQLIQEKEKLENKARFILMVVDGKLKVAKRAKKEILHDLIKLGFKRIPKKAAKKGVVAVDEDAQADENESQQAMNDESPESTNASDYDYLLSMPIWSLTMERVDQLCSERDAKVGEARAMEAKSAETMWEEDLKTLYGALEADRREHSDSKSSIKSTKGLGPLGGNKKGGSKAGKKAITMDVDKELSLENLTLIEPPQPRAPGAPKKRAVSEKTIGKSNADSMVNEGIVGVARVSKPQASKGSMKGRVGSKAKSRKLKKDEDDNSSSMSDEDSEVDNVDLSKVLESEESDAESNSNNDDDDGDDDTEFEATYVPKPTTKRQTATAVHKPRPLDSSTATKLGSNSLKSATSAASHVVGENKQVPLLSLADRLALQRGSVSLSSAGGATSTKRSVKEDALVVLDSSAFVSGAGSRPLSKASTKATAAMKTKDRSIINIVNDVSDDEDEDVGRVGKEMFRMEEIKAAVSMVPGSNPCSKSTKKSAVATAGNANADGDDDVLIVCETKLSKPPGGKRARTKAAGTSKNADGKDEDELPMSTAMALLGPSSSGAQGSPDTKTPDAKRKKAGQCVAGGGGGRKGKAGVGRKPNNAVTTGGSKLKKGRENYDSGCSEPEEEEDVSSDEEARILESIQRRGVTPVQRPRRERKPMIMNLVDDGDEEEDEEDDEEDDDTYEN